MEPVGAINGIVIDCADPLPLARFWCEVFATQIEGTEGDPPTWVDLEARPGVPTLRFQLVPEAKVVKNRLYLDVEVGALDAAVARVEALGAAAVTERATEYGWHYSVMADPEGNEFCLIERARA